MKTAQLVLADGTTFTGKSFGADVSSAGEVVFNTGMMGYPESLTDPSYRGQIITFTYPLVGNYGIGGSCKEEGIEKRFESNEIQVKGLVVSEYCEEFSHWDSRKSLGTWLKDNRIPAITGIDTRRLTQKIREHGTILGKIVIEPTTKNPEPNFYNPDLDNLVAQVSIKRPKVYKKGPKRVVCIDCGIKNNIIRNFLKRNITVIRVPWNYNFLSPEARKAIPELKTLHGIFISNGPGDPAMLTETIENIQESLKLEKPIFGICLGLQLLALAAGATTYKLKFGHRSQNQPAIDEETGHCYITSQNHGFAVREKSLPKGWKVWLKNANDKTIEGIKHTSKPFFAAQFHPEATPGPTDTMNFFDKFIEML